MTDKPNGRPRRPRRSKEDVPPATTEHVEAGADFLVGVVERMGLELTVKGEVDGKRASFELDGKDSEKVGAGLGQGKGVVPQALTTLVSMSLGRIEGGRPHVKVRVAGKKGSQEDKAAREEQLEGVASFLGTRVAELGVPVVVMGMSSGDRRIIHRGLGDGGGMQTESEGYGSFRRLKVQPK